MSTYHGKAFIAEREGDELNIYIVSGDNISTGTVGDKSAGMTASRLQRQNEALRIRQAEADARAGAR